MAEDTTELITFLFFSAEWTFDPFEGQQLRLGQDQSILHDKRLFATRANGRLH